MLMVRKKMALLLTWPALFGVLLAVSPGCGEPYGDGSEEPLSIGPAKALTIERQPAVDLLTASFRDFWNYWYDSIELSRDFIGLDASGSRLTKIAFLEQLTTGRYVPLLVGIRRSSREAELDLGVYTYQLKLLPNGAAASISDVIQQEAELAIQYYEMEGRALPAFDFTTINDKTYSNKACLGNFVVLDTWFVHCTACVQEMPALNRWVGDLKERSDILFLSLCLDEAPAIKQFLEKQPFAFEIVPEAERYIRDQLGLSQYPTKILVGKDGKMIKVGDFSAIKRALMKATAGESVAGL